MNAEELRPATPFEKLAEKAIFEYTSSAEWNQVSGLKWHTVEIIEIVSKLLEEYAQQKEGKELDKFAQYVEDEGMQWIEHFGVKNILSQYREKGLDH
jgi:hypothetical protein